MSAWLKAASATLAATVLAGSAAAQETCDIQTRAPNEMRSALESLTRYQLGSGTPQQRHDYLVSAIRATTDRPERFRTNEVGRQYALGQALAFFAVDEEMPVMSRRGDVGFSSNENELIDLVAAADSAFTNVERALPGCREELEGFRAQMWQRLLQDGVRLAHEGNTDSAVVIIRRALSVYDGLPHGHYYLAAVLQQGGRIAEAVAAFRETAERISADDALEDTTLAEFRDNAVYIVALSRYERADTLPDGAEKTEAMREAARMFREHIDEFPDSERAGNSRILLMSAYSTVGDSAALNLARRQMIEQADEFTAVQLLEAGTHAFNTQDTELAVALLEKGIEKNPYSRPGLFNLANVYWATKRFDRMVPTAHRLVQLDPNNPNNFEILAVAMENQAQTIQNAQQRKVQMDSVRMLVDRAQTMPIQVTFNALGMDGAVREVSGQIRNATQRQREVTIEIEFLDEGGRVVARESQQLTIPAQGQENVRVRIENREAVGFRYAPIS